jgi:hypothetical protein
VPVPIIIVVRWFMSAMKRALLPSIVAGLVLAACAGPSTVSRSVHEDPSLIVRLENLPKPDHVTVAPNARPAAFTDDDLTQILRSVMIQKEIDFWRYYALRQDPKPERALLDEDIASLVPHLNVALAQARSDERVVFWLSRTRHKGITEVTSGSLSVRGDRCSLLLANVRVPVTTGRKMERARTSPLTPLEQPNFMFVTGPHQTLLGMKDASLAPNPTGRGGLLIAHRALLNPAPQSVDTQTTSAPPPTTLEDKLRQLKGWRDQGLITEQQYQDKIQRLLDSL